MVLLLKTMKYCRRMVEEVECTLGRHNFLDVKFFTPSMADCRQHCQDTLLCRFQWTSFLENVWETENYDQIHFYFVTPKTSLLSRIVPHTHLTYPDIYLKYQQRQAHLFLSPFVLPCHPILPQDLPQILSLPPLAPPSPPLLSPNTRLLYNVMKTMWMMMIW